MSQSGDLQRLPKADHEIESEEKGPHYLSTDQENLCLFHLSPSSRCSLPSLFHFLYSSCKSSMCWGRGESFEMIQVLIQIGLDIFTPENNTVLIPKSDHKNQRELPEMFPKRVERRSNREFLKIVEKKKTNSLLYPIKSSLFNIYTHAHMYVYLHIFSVLHSFQVDEIYLSPLVYSSQQIVKWSCMEFPIIEHWGVMESRNGAQVYDWQLVTGECSPMGWNSPQGC